MENRDFQILKKILLEIDVLEEMIMGFDLEKFIQDERTKRAVCMTLINIGELVKNLNEDFRQIYKEVPWRGIAGMRDITAHKYQTLKMGDVWTTLENDIPDFKTQLLDIVND
jgi:uncharacterized protein with HEPN domain